MTEARPASSKRQVGKLVIGALVIAATCWLAVTARARISLQADAQRSRRLIAAGEYQDATIPLQRWLKAEPDSAEARYLVARQAMGLGRYEAGLVALEQARARGYPESTLNRERGLALVRLGRLTEAEPLLRAVFIAQKNAGVADPELDEGLARCYLETFQLRAAQEVTDRWIRDAPGDARAYYWRAETEQRKADADSAVMIPHYERVLELEPEHDKARLALAELYLKSHRVQDAAREFTTHLRRHPDNFDACLGLGQIAAAEGRDEEATHQLERARALAPRDPRPLVERGKMELQRGRLATALELFDKAVALDSAEPEVHFQRSVILGRLGRHQEAQKERDDAARLRKQRDELASLLKELNQSPGDVRLQYAAARWLWDHGHPEEAVQWAMNIVREHPRHAEANRLLASYHEKQGNQGLANFYRAQAEEK
jgi:tetratricopeptide (TPR) repeat protein